MTEWHVPEGLVSAFAAEPERVDEVAAASVEQHLAVCGRCQRAVASAADPLAVDAAWTEIEDRIDQRQPGWDGRLARVTGSDGSFRLIAATAGLQLGALTAVAMVVVLVVLTGRSADSADIFMALAPLVPTALVAMTFAPGADPAGEAGRATPVYGFGLLMRRTLAVEIVALVVLGVAAAFVPIGGLRTLGWVLPSLALSALTIAGGARWPAPAVGVAAASAWMAVVGAAARYEPGHDIVRSAPFDPAGQLVAAAIAVVAAVVILSNRQTLLMEAPR